jgi:hypothetical protein
MRIVLTQLLLVSAITLLAQEKFDPNKKHHPDSLRRWTKSVMDGISEKHPGFYRYTSKGKFDHLIDSTSQTIKDSLTEINFYRKLKPLFAQIGCMHTGVSLSKEYEGFLDQTSTLLPLEIFIDSDRSVLISKSYVTNQEIPLKAELVSINGRPIGEILNTLLRAIPSDGYNQTEKILLLNHRFAFWYQTIIEAVESFHVEIITDGQVRMYDLKGVSKPVFPTLESLERNYTKPLEFDIVDGIGILKVHSFGKTTMNKYGMNFKKFTKDAFKRMKKANISNLVMDLRYNTGGTDGHATLLASYFFDKPFRYWDKIEVTEAIAKEIKGFNRLFYKKPRNRNGSYQWKKIWITKEFDYYETQKPAKNNFMGNTIIITNGLCLSSCADFVAVLSHNKKAVVVGQETGGGFQGNNSGMMPKATIPTGLRITVPLQKYTNAVDLKKNFGHGTQPDHEVTPTVDDWIQQRDVEMQYALKLAKEGMAQGNP